MDIFNEDPSAGIAFSPGTITKESITLRANSIVGDVFSGNLCPLETYIKSKAISDVASSICKEIKDDASPFITIEQLEGVLKHTKIQRKVWDYIALLIEKDHEKIDYLDYEKQNEIT